MAQTPDSTTKHIAEIQTSDREAARKAVAQGVQSAKEKWIEAPLIVEALALELVSVAQTNHSSSMMAAYLRNLADAMEAQATYH
ncbi:MAG TPA: hypothetical protein DCZ13_11245 [Porticoccaceae bacterium]|nr:hypothetical protein [Porticoccaceae bacterium]